MPDAFTRAVAPVRDTLNELAELRAAAASLRAESQELVDRAKEFEQQARKIADPDIIDKIRTFGPFLIRLKSDQCVVLSAPGSDPLQRNTRATTVQLLST